MRKNFWIILALVFILPTMLFTVSCAKKAVKVEEPMAETQPVVDDQAAKDREAAAAAERERLEAERLMAEEAQRANMTKREMFSSEDIYFEFDSAALLPGAQQILVSKADYMRAMNNLTVTVEGHCDERGTDAYNLALGERRAEAAKAFLLDMGVNPAQVSIISYGEERPMDLGNNEEAWAKNRRAHFAID